MPSDATIDAFVELMKIKLRKNAHKDGLNSENVQSFITLMRKEVVEFEEQAATDLHDPNSMFELADIANFAVLLFEYLVIKEGMAIPTQETPRV